jgi:hypothetical protein
VKRSLFIGVIVCLLALWASLPVLPPAQGQAGTPTITPTALPLIDRPDAEVMFPAFVRLGLYLNVGVEAVAEASVRVFQPGVYDLTHQVRIPDDTLPPAANKVLITYLWPIEADNLSFPAPFSRVYYQWQVRLKDGPLLRAQSSFILEDTRQPDSAPAAWQSTGEPPLQFYSHNSNLALAQIYNVAARIYAKIAGDSGINKPYQFVLYDPDSALCRVDEDGSSYVESRFIGGLRRPCDPDNAVAYYRTHGFTLVRRPNNILADLQGRLAEVMATEAIAAMWRGRENAAEPWLAEGLIQLYSLNTRNAALALVRKPLAI